jgi:hypothetical protein
MMRISIAIVAGLLLGSSLMAEQRVRLTVQYRTFVTTDAEKGKWWDEHFSSLKGVKPASLRILEENEKPIEHECTTLIVHMSAPFESHTVQRERTFDVSGELTPFKNGKSTLLNIQSVFQKPSPYALPDGTTRPFTKSIHTTTEIQMNEWKVLSGYYEQRETKEKGIQRELGVFEVKAEKVE